MVIFKSIAYPEPSQGEDYSKVESQVVPDQSLSLKEILDRFSLNEPLDVEFAAQDGEEFDGITAIDLEKMKYADLVDKAEFVEKLKSFQSEFERKRALEVEKQQREAEEAARLAAEAKIEAEVQARLHRLEMLQKRQQS